MQGFEIPATAKTQGVLCVLETMKYLKIVTKALEKAPEKVAALIAQLQCVYSSAYSMGNKQGELEADVQQESYDTVADEIFYNRLGEVSQSLALVAVVAFNLD